MERIQTMKEIASILNISIATVYRLINKGLITPVRISRKNLFKPSDIRALIDTGRGL
ncbi:MAG: helix-turn-helix domain-containing protein [Nitrospirae bacterium YQR-1]